MVDRFKQQTDEELVRDFIARSFPLPKSGIIRPYDPRTSYPTELRKYDVFDHTSQKQLGHKVSKHEGLAIIRFYRDFQPGFAQTIDWIEVETTIRGGHIFGEVFGIPEPIRTYTVKFEDRILVENVPLADARNAVEDFVSENQVYYRGSPLDIDYQLGSGTGYIRILWNPGPRTNPETFELEGSYDQPSHDIDDPIIGDREEGPVIFAGNVAPPTLAPRIERHSDGKFDPVTGTEIQKACGCERCINRRARAHSAALKAKRIGFQSEISYMGPTNEQLIIFDARNPKIPLHIGVASDILNFVGSPAMVEKYRTRSLARNLTIIPLATWRTMNKSPKKRH